MSSKYSIEALQTALKEVKSGSITAYMAHKQYGIPKTTISDKLKDKHSGVCGGVAMLSADTEKQLVDWICLCAASGCPKTTKEILDAAKDLAMLDGKSFKGVLPSHGWLRRFLKRHPEISKRVPEALGRASAGLTYDRLKGYFDFLHRQFEHNQLLDLLDNPERWWNVDETNFVLNPIPKKVFAKKGAKVVYNVERGKPKENITCTYAVAANGDFIPPLITFKNSFNNLIAAATTSGAVGANFGFNQTESGWMKGDAFFYFVTQHLHPRWDELGIQRPIVLVVDGYSGHHSLKLFKWCYENKIMLVVLYPNATHILQVLDVAVFGPLKAKYTELYQKWKTEHPGIIFNEIEFIKILKQANDNVLNKDMIINGWRSTGLQPFNFSNIKTERLLREASSTDEHNADLISNNKSLEAGIEQQDAPFQVQSAELPSFINNTVNERTGIDLDDALLDLEVSNQHSIQPHVFQHSATMSYEDSIDQLYMSSFDMNPENLFESNSNVTNQLVSNVRSAVENLRAHLHSNDPSKLLNILIMEQQLNIIDPIIVDNLSSSLNDSVPVNTSSSSPKPRTAADILKVQTCTKKSERQKKGLKVSFGVMSDLQIIEEMEQRESDEKEFATDRKRDEKAKSERAKRLNELKENVFSDTQRLKNTRQELKNLQAEAAAERKKVAVKRKIHQNNKKKQGKQLINSDYQDSHSNKKRLRR